MTAGSVRPCLRTRLPAPDGTPVDLLVAGADLVVTMDDDRREIAGGWVACAGGFVTAVGGPADAPPAADRCCGPTAAWSRPAWSTRTTTSTRTSPGPILPATSSTLFDWLTTLYPRWALLDEEASYVSAWVGLAELAVGRLHHLDRPPLRPPGRRAATCCRPRSRPPATSACASTPPGGRCRCRRRTAACRPTRWSRTTTPSSPPARRRSPATTTPRPGRWCGWRWPRARRSR